MFRTILPQQVVRAVKWEQAMHAMFKYEEVRKRGEKRLGHTFLRESNGLRLIFFSVGLFYAPFILRERANTLKV